jgi:hypothetical protein
MPDVMNAMVSGVAVTNKAVSIVNLNEKALCDV